MNADSAFLMGSSHAVCQDYSRAGARPPAAPSGGLRPESRPYVILSDGCSSSADTDIGARLLVKAAERILLGLDGSPARGAAEIHEEAARLALSWAELLGLSRQAVDATLLTAHLEGEELIMGCSGDGVICLQSWEGGVDVYSVSYPSGYPLYPSYAHQPERLRALEGAGRTGKEVRRFRAASAGGCLRPKGASCGDSPTEVFTVRAADYKFAALFSDGVHSFTHAAEAGAACAAVSLCEIVRGLISFKSTRGAFVGRRMRMFLKDCRQRGWRHTDDLAVGALHLGGSA